MRKTVRTIIALLVLALFSVANNAVACAVCAGGKTDSELARGMNWGIFTLLFVVVCVLGGFATFFVYLVKKSSDAALVTPESLREATQKI